MARSFNEAYGIKVQAWAASQLAATRYSKIVDVEVHEGFEEDPGFMNVMKQKIEEYKNHPEPVILIACGDGYAELLAKHKDELKAFSDYYSQEIMNYYSDEYEQKIKEQVIASLS